MWENQVVRKSCPSLPVTRLQFTRPRSVQCSVGMISSPQMCNPKPCVPIMSAHLQGSTINSPSVASMICTTGMISSGTCNPNARNAPKSASNSSRNYTQAHCIRKFMHHTMSMDISNASSVKCSSGSTSSCTTMVIDYTECGISRNGLKVGMDLNLRKNWGPHISHVSCKTRERPKPK